MVEHSIDGIANGYLATLRGLTHDDRPRAGVKAVALGELARAGFPVPDGVVLTVAAFDHFLAANGLGPDAAPEQIAAARLPPAIADALCETAMLFASVPLAVRSSGVAEDLPGASYAGQYETVLGVRGHDALVEAVRYCWTAAFGERAATYHAARGGVGVPAMAILIQRLVPANASGVAFTANPVTGDRLETVVSAVRGLGERLVAGEATPDEWLIRGTEVTCRAAPEGAIGAGQARAIADLARRVERHFGVPQDIEWAIADGELVLLQARPITALPELTTQVVLPFDPPPGYWQRIADHYPTPVSPMFRAFFDLINTEGERALAEAGLLLGGKIGGHREIGGWVYLNSTGLADRPPPPPWLVRLLMPAMFRVVPRLRVQLRRCVEAVRSDKPRRDVERWYAEWQPALAARITALRGAELTVLPDKALDDYFDQVIDLAREGLFLHVVVHIAGWLMLGELAFACRDLLGWDDGRTFALVSGLSARSTEPARQLASLARLARERPAVHALLARPDDLTAERLAGADPEFAAAFAAYLREFGCRALRYEIAEPTLEERPALVLRLIRDQLARDYDPEAEATLLARQRAAAIADARAALADRPATARAGFEHALARGELAYPLREDNEFYSVSAPLALWRYAALEVGRRLTERGALMARDDVFFLELAEARAALREGGDWQALVARRKAERAWVEAHPGPAAFGMAPGPPPSLTALPVEARFALESMMWLIERALESEQSAREQPAGERLTGIAASPGRYTGPVRVIRGEAEFEKLRPGEVLVCPITSPVWSVLFPSVGALVTDTGGILSHAAIIAREYRVPAVVATGNATRLLEDGQVVTVDGDMGLIQVQP